MKYPIEQYNTLVKDLPIVLDFFKLDVNLIEPSDIGLLNHLHYRVYQQKNFPDHNANVKFVNGARLLPIDETFKLYPEGCNDNHIETAIKQAIKQLQA